MSDIPFGERVTGRGGPVEASKPIPDLRISVPPVVERVVVREPEVVFPTEPRDTISPVTADDLTDSEVQPTEGMKRDEIEGKRAIELGGKVAVERAFDSAAANELRPANPFAGLPQSPDEVTGQLELPFDELPAQPGAYVQGELDFGSLSTPVQEQDLAAPSQELVPFDEVVVGEIVDESEIRSPEQIVAEQKDITHQALKAAVKEHERLVAEHEEQWKLFVDALRGAKPVHRISYYEPVTGSFNVNWRIDDNSHNPLANVDGTAEADRSTPPDFDNSGDVDAPKAAMFRFFDISMERSDFDHRLPQEAQRAVDWLAENRPDGKRKELRGTTLLGVPAKKDADGVYGYDTDTLSMNLASELINHARRALVSYYVREDPEAAPQMHDSGLMVKAPDSYTRQMHKDLQEIRDGGERTERIIEKNLERFRLRAQLDPEDRYNPLAFPAAEEIVDILRERYLYVQEDEVESLRKLNHDLAGLMAFSRSFRGGKPSSR